MFNKFNNSESSWHSLRLVGRDKQVGILTQAYERSLAARRVGDDGNKAAETSQEAGKSQQRHRPELVLVTGKSGTGKTALATSLIARVNLDTGYVLSGKFEITALQPRPYAVFVSAFSQLADMLENDEERRSAVAKSILDAVGKEQVLLINIIPALEKILGQQNGDQEERCKGIKGHETLHQFQLLFCKLCVAVSTVAPLVLFFDDLQWSDVASLQLLRSLLRFLSSPSESFSSSSFLLIGAYRDEADIQNENDDDARPSSTPTTFLSYLSQFHDLSVTAQLNLTNICLENLDEASTNELVADIIQKDAGGCEDRSQAIGRLAAEFIPADAEDDCEDRSQAVFRQSKGNPFHIIQILKNVQTNSLFPPVSDKNGTATETMDELVLRKLSLLPKITQKVLQTAAFIGDELAISVVLDASMGDVEQSLQVACDDGHLVFDAPRGCYRFSHDRIRQAAMLLLDGAQGSLAYEIGHLLWIRSYTDNVFVVANLLNSGINHMVDAEERYKAATLNLEAALTATTAAAFPEASRYLSAGIAFLRGGDFWRCRLGRLRRW